MTITLRPPSGPLLGPLLAALLLPALTACVAPPSEGGAGEPGAPFPGLFGARDAGPPEPAPLPPAVLAALPPGVPSSVVLEDGQGCYLYSIERTDPPSGYPLRDAAGNQVCEGGAAPVAVAGLAADVAASVPPGEPALFPSAAVSPASFPPVEEGPAEGEGPIDITPVLEAPLPPAAPASAPAPGAVPVDGSVGGPLVGPITPVITPGDITPPAPLAPLN